MTTYTEQKFECFYDQDSGRTFENLGFQRCFFESSAISITRNPRLRSTVRNVRAIDCEVGACSLYSPIVEDVLVEDLKIGKLLIAWGAVFRHVTLRGRIGAMMLSPFPVLDDEDNAAKPLFDAANVEYYRNVDWALDISQAEFSVECDLRGVPGRLVRRDPETQVLVTRKKAMEADWRTHPLLAGTKWARSIDFLLEVSAESEVVLTAPKRNRRFRELLQGLQLLRRLGVAEPD